MGFVGFLRFLFLCLDFLAWPTFALGYPLWASIRAIETSSNHRMKKLVTYWTLFALISLFELIFSKLVEWTPFWPYIKLIAICWLVIPRFNGACHVYQSLVQPCLLLNLQNFNCLFSKPKEKQCTKAAFLASAEAYLKENGSEDLEKLIADKAKPKEVVVSDALEVEKTVEPTERNLAAEEQVAKPKEVVVSDALEVEKTVVPTERNVAAEEQVVKRSESYLAQTKNKIAANKVWKVKMTADNEKEGLLEFPAVGEAQREWTCAMCQVTTTSETTLNLHLLGREHKSKYEELKTGIQTAKNMQSLTPKANDSNQATKKPKNCPPGEGLEQKTTKKSENHHIKAASERAMQKNPKNKNSGVVIEQYKFWCSICNVRCSGEVDLASHLKGWKHLSRIQS